MKSPRDLNPQHLKTSLSAFGYHETRQVGSHIRITTEQDGQHHEVIPAHDPVKIGTLHSILSSIAGHHGLTVEGLLSKLDL